MANNILAMRAAAADFFCNCKITVEFCAEGIAVSSNNTNTKIGSDSILLNAGTRVLSALMIAKPAVGINMNLAR